MLLTVIIEVCNYIKYQYQSTHFYRILQRVAYKSIQDQACKDFAQGNNDIKTTKWYQGWEEESEPNIL